MIKYFLSNIVTLLFPDIKKTMLIIISISCCVLSLSGQSDSPVEFPNSPEANKLIGQVVSIVDYNSGLASLEIPIYEIKLKDFSLPIKISYTSSGFKPNETSQVGIGWTLHSEPFIARQVNGIPDDRYFLNGNLNYSNSDYADMGGYLSLGTPSRDGKPDQFFYSLNSLRGSFFTQRDFLNPNVKGFVTYPYHPINIESDSRMENFEIIDPDGTIYNLRGTEETKIDAISYASCYKASQITTINGEFITFEYGEEYQGHVYNDIESARLEMLEDLSYSPTLKFGPWYDMYNYREKHGLSGYNEDIVPPSEIDYLYGIPKFIHHSAPSSGTSYRENYYHVKNNNMSDLKYFFSNPDTPLQYATDTRNNHRSKFCTKITFPGGSVDFLYIRPENLNHSNADVILNEIIVKDSKKEIIRRVKFDVETDDNEWYKRPRLDAVHFLNKNGDIEETFSMEYNGMANHRLPIGRNWCVNSWGYRDNIVGPVKTYPQLDPDTIVGMLPYYITKGHYESYEFVFDSNNYMYGIRNDYYITDSLSRLLEPMSMLSKITYPTKGFTTFIYEPSRFFHSQRLETVYTGALRIKSIKDFSENGDLIKTRTFTYGQDEAGLGIPAQELTSDDFKSISRTNDWAYMQIGWACSWDHLFNRYVIKYSPFPTAIRNDLSTSSSIIYDKVTEYVTDIEGNSFGKIEYVYDYDNIDYIRDQKVYNGGVVTNRYTKKYLGWQVGQLKEKNVYGIKNDALSLLNKTSYTYANKWSNQGPVKILDVYAYEEKKWDYFYYCPCETCNDNSTLNDYAAGYGTDGAPGVDFIKDYYQFTSGVRVLNEECSWDFRENGTIEVKKTYDYNDKLAPTNIIYHLGNGKQQIQNYKYPDDFNGVIFQEMIRRNMISKPVEETLLNGDTILSKTETGFMVDNNLIKPSQTLYYIQNNIVKKYIYNRYDNYGNLIHYTDVDNMEVVCLWSYLGQYPIAEIRNATYEQVKAALGSPPETISTTLNPPSSENLRKKLDVITNAQVTTYTYNPLIGITSITDPQGLTTFYGYDSFGRLIEIYYKENDKKHIIKTYQYNYSIRE